MKDLTLGVPSPPRNTFYAELLRMAIVTIVCRQQIEPRSSTVAAIKASAICMEWESAELLAKEACTRGDGLIDLYHPRRPEAQACRRRATPTCHRTPGQAPCTSPPTPETLASHPADPLHALPRRFQISTSVSTSITAALSAVAACARHRHRALPIRPDQTQDCARHAPGHGSLRTASTPPVPAPAGVMVTRSPRSAAASTSAVCRRKSLMVASMTSSVSQACEHYITKPPTGGNEQMKDLDPEEPSPAGRPA